MFSRYCLILLVSLLTVACSNKGEEELIVGLINAANLDVVAIDFSERDRDLVVSASSVHTFRVHGIQSNGAVIELDNALLVWSVSAAAASGIDQAGTLTAAPGAENLQVTARLGNFVDTTNVRVSTARFDRVVAFPLQAATMLASCRPVTVEPLAAYIDDNGGEEIRLLDSNVLPTVSWNVSDAMLDPSPRAFIQNNVQDVSLYGLATGAFSVSATAFSVADNVSKTSDMFSVDVQDFPQAVKICERPAADLASCEAIAITSMSSGDVREYLAVGSYVSTIDGSTSYTNISRSVKWGNSNAAAYTMAYIAGESDTDDASLQLSQVSTGEGTMLDAVCGSITETVPLNTLGQGTLINAAITCDAADTACRQASLQVNSVVLTAQAMEVSLDGTVLVDNQVETLATRPTEFSLDVNVTLSDNSIIDVTADSATTYTIIQADGDPVIELKADTSATFTVLTAGLAQIQISYDTLTFLVLIDIP